MRRPMAMLGVAALLLGACSSGDEEPTSAPTSEASESEAPDADATDDAEGDDPEGDDAAENTTSGRTYTPTLPDDFEPSVGGSGTEADDAGDGDPGDGDAGDGGGDAGSGGTTTALGSWDTTSATPNRTSPFAPLAEPVVRPRHTDPTASCQVLPAAGETVEACASALVDSRGDAAFAVAVMTDQASGTTTTRLFHQDGSGNMVASAGFDGAASDLVATHWSRGDELIRFEAGTSGQYVVGWSTGAAPQVVLSTGEARFGGQELWLVAGRAIDLFEELGGGSIAVFDPTDPGSAGTKVSYDTDDPPPVVVALKVYEKWIAGDWDGMAGMATPEVVAALRSARTRTDLFVFQGTDCVRESATTARCAFDSDGQVTTWRLERRGGVVQVVDLK